MRISDWSSDVCSSDLVEQAIEELKQRASQQMRARIATIPAGVYEGSAVVDSDGVVDEPLLIRMKVTKTGEEMHFAITGSRPPFRGPTHSEIAPPYSPLYLAVQHIFSTVLIHTGPIQ